VVVPTGASSAFRASSYLCECYCLGRRQFTFASAIIRQPTLYELPRHATESRWTIVLLNLELSSCLNLWTNCHYDI